ncbi:MAG: MBL fold metallo-hydrolase [Spirochaetes bacterium]|nr:MBL fold metallo-hydrolase [Spirochaetota bacterium]
MAKIMKRILIALAILLALLLIGGGLAWKLRPAPGPTRLELPHGASGVLMTYVYAWVVPTASGVVLIDAGGDAKAPELLAELKRRGKGPMDVKAILLTHGHFDHWPGTAAFPKATVYVHPAELATMRGVKKSPHLLLRVMGAFRKAQPLPRAIAALHGDENLKIDGESFQAVSIPGHTEGSLMYLWRGILFTGDSVQAGKDGGLALPPAMFSEELSRLDAELRKTLPKWTFEQLATSHTGLILDGAAALRKYLAKDPAAK